MSALARPNGPRSEVLGALCGSRSQPFRRGPESDHEVENGGNDGYFDQHEWERRRHAASVRSQPSAVEIGRVLERDAGHYSGTYMAPPPTELTPLVA